MAEQITNQATNHGLAITSLVLGVVSIAMMFLWFISIPAGVLAIIFGAVSLKSPGHSMALAGLITGCVSIALILLFVLFIVALGVASL